MVGWGITKKCNLSCPHCYSSAVKKVDQEFTTEECFGLTDQIAELGTRTIGWTGGEPLLRKDLEEIMSYARDKHGIGAGLTTNGVLITEKRIRQLKEAGLKTVQISLDGSTAEKNYRIRRATDRQFEFVIRGIKLSRANDLDVTMAMVISRDNFEDVLDYLDLARSLDVGHVRFCGFVPAGFATSESIQDRMAWRREVRKLRELVEVLQEIEKPEMLFDPGFGPLAPAYDFHKCHSGKGIIYIDPDGNVYPCTGLLNDRFKVGNVRERTLKDIANDPRMFEMCDYDRTHLSGPCGDCPYLMVCRGACRGATFAHTGDLNASFPVCLYQAD